MLLLLLFLLLTLCVICRWSCCARSGSQSCTDALQFRAGGRVVRTQIMGFHVRSTYEPQSSTCQVACKAPILWVL